MKFLKNIDSLSKLPFYEGLNVIKTNHGFKGYPMSYKGELIEKKDPLIQKEVNQVLKNCLMIFQMKQKGFKYKVTLKVDLKKYKGTKIEFSSVYFNSPAKAVANH